MSLIKSAYICIMIQIDSVLISDALAEEHFCCDLSKCKGACCEAGEEGAPLKEEETAILDEIYNDFETYLDREGIDAVKAQGKWVKTEGGYATPLIGKHGRCAYSIRDKKGAWSCAIEKAHAAGEVGWKKPISCHLYPIRVTEYPTMTAMNYEQWDVCNDACTLGQSLKLPIYNFCKDSIERAYGEEFYQIMDEAFKRQQSED